MININKILIKMTHIVNGYLHIPDCQIKEQINIIKSYETFKEFI